MTTGPLASALVACTLVAGCDPEPFTLVVSVRDTALVAYRDGDRAWKPVEPEEGKARIQITRGRYSLAWVCNGPLASYVLHSTLADEPQAYCSSTVPEVAQLSGTTTPNAIVYVDSRVVPADAAGNYFTFVASGYHDIVAVSSGEPSRVALQRDVDVRGDRQLDLPIAEQGNEMRVLQPIVTGAPQAITLRSELHTRRGDLVVFPNGGEVVAAVPSQVLVDGDVQLVRAVGEQCLRQVPIGDDTPRLELPVAPAVIVERTRVRTPSDDDWRYLRLEARTLRGLYAISATREWMEEADTDAVEIPDLSLLPGFRWDLLHIAPGDPVDWTVTTERGNRRSTFAACATTDTMTW